MNDAHSGRHYAEGGPEDGQDPYAQQYYDPYAQQQQQPQPQYDQYGQPYYDPYAQQQAQQQQQQAQRRGPQPQQQYDQYGQQQGQQQQQQAQRRGPQPQPQPQPQQRQQQYDQYGQPYYDPYAQQAQHQAAQQQAQHQAAQQQAQRQPPPQQIDEQQWIPQQQSYDTYEQPIQQQAQQSRARSQQPPPQSRQPQVPAQAGPRDPAAPSPSADYRTEQFSFIEEPDEESDDVIDWLKFAETRSERRDERKRKGRNRVVTLVVVLVLALGGGVGYLWYAGKLPGLAALDSGGTAAGGPQTRDVIALHLRDTRGGRSSTALLVDNKTTKKGTTVLLPNSLAVATDDGGSTTLGKSVEDEGTTPTRDALGTLLGAEIKGSWRLDTPYLENLVELIGGITVDTDATVPGAKKGDDPLVKQGKQQTLSGQAAVAYATHLGPGERQTDQLLRFGKVMQAVMKKTSSDREAATKTVQTLNQIPDPSLTEAQLGASLAELAEQAKNGSYQTAVLPVQPDGTLSESTADSVVKDVLGGTVKNTDPDAAPRVSVRNATGDRKATSTVQVTLVNSGYTFVDGGSASAAQTASRVTYGDAAQAEKAKEVAKTLGLQDSAVKKGRGAANADITVVLGQDYKAG
ncbi:LCP family protein [Streptomyces sp. NPDC004647]|uniref:LCP family protein n=1 Tax=Streptomyces sp. NPDC004647 TaxID=3154671 RepID=UPI00339E4FC7